MTGRSIVSGPEPSTTQTEYDAFLASFGQLKRPELIRRAKKSDGGLYVGVFVMSRVGEAKSFIGTTSSPHDIAKQLHRFSWEDTQCDLVAWTEDRKIATHLLGLVKLGLKPVHHRDSWYGIEGDRAAQIVVTLAERARIDIFGDQERERRLEEKVSGEIAVLKRRMDGSKQIIGLPPAMDRTATIIPLKKPRRDQ